MGDMPTKIWPPLSQLGYALSNHGKRYVRWLHELRSFDALPLEYLTPVVRIPNTGEPSRSMAIARERFDRAAVAEIQSSAIWGYFFELGGGESTLGPIDSLRAADEESRWRSYYRMRQICGGLESVFGDDLAKMDVLDMACNWGAFSLEMAARGVKSVLGVDYRQENVTKAEMLKSYTGIENVRYAQGDVFDLEEQADLVLNLGLLYHVTLPYELVAKTFELCRKAAVIDTVVHREPFSGFVLGTGSYIPHEHAAGKIRTELHPTYRGLLDLMQIVGFKEIVELEAEPDAGWKSFEHSLFGNKYRRAILGFK